MSPWLMVWTRCLLLVALLGLCLWGLLHGIAVSHGANAAHLLPTRDGEDPGIRVLLTERTGRERNHDRVTLVIQQAAWLFAPDNIGQPEWRLSLAPQETLMVWPNPVGGLSLQAGDGVPRDWPVERLRLLPAYSTADGDSLNPLARDPTRSEAADFKAVFATLGLRYRGNLDLIRASARGMLMVNQLPMEAYVAGVVPVEMSPSWPVEALKAQAVCARSYALAKRLQQSQRPWDLVDSVDDQSYRGDTDTSTEVLWAVRETKGRVLSYQGLAFAPLYHASSGGRTASISATFPELRAGDGRTALDSVMPPLADPWAEIGARLLGWTGSSDSRWAWQAEIGGRELRNLLLQYVQEQGSQQAVGFIQAINVLERTADRVSTLEILTNESKFTFSGEAFRRLVGPARLRSLLWQPDSPQPPSRNRETFLFAGLGFGHGVGLSQVSAYAMARQGGLDHRAILAFFYPGSELRKQW